MCTPLPERALRYAGSVATSVLPSPVAISAILPSCRTIPPMSCTSKWRMPSERRAASRQTANASGSTSSISAPPARRLRSSSVRERRAASSRACTGGSSTLISATTGIIRLTSRSCLVPKIFLRIAARRALEAEAYNAPAMIDAILKKIFGPKHERDVKRMMPVVAEINALEPAIQALDDAALRGKTDELRKRLADGAEVEDVLPDALALSVGVIQHEASFTYDPAYTTPDLRMTALRPIDRRTAYLCDITYGTNNEFGFDYLRDNMRFSLEELVQRELHYAIVDEVDSILIDEARTPLIISGPAEESTELYYKIDRIIPKLKRAATIVEGKLSEIEEERESDFIVDEKSKAVSLTEQGIASCERLLNVDNLYDPQHITILHHVQQGLRAHALYKRDVDYVVKDGEVIIVDEFTGRMMPGRRWSDGLHQAVEAKEGVRIERENQTLATITFQNYFRMYDKLAGMTGTAETEAEEFAKIYKLDVVVIPTNRPLTRVNNPDVVYKTEREKFNAVVEDIIERHGRGQPVLVGTISIEKSERLSTLLKKRGVRHEVLNAKYHEREAEIVAQAGRQSAVTIATNMAGRGTDILLGGNPDFLSKELLRKKGLDPATAPAEARQAALVEARRITEPEHEKVVATGGLHIVGTERHESRRIDNQLRGRSGRQGDPGSSPAPSPPRRSASRTTTSRSASTFSSTTT